MNDEKNVESAFGVTQEQISKVKNFDPTLNIELDVTYTVKFLDDLPHEIELAKDAQRFGRSIARVIKVENVSDGMYYSLFCTPETLSVRLAQLAIKHNNSLKGVIVRMGKKQVNLKTFGLKNVYWCQEITEEESRKAVAFSDNSSKYILCSDCHKPLLEPTFSIEEGGVKKFYCDVCAEEQGMSKN